MKLEIISYPASHYPLIYNLGTFAPLLSGCRVWTSVLRALFTFRANLVEIFLSLHNITSYM